MLIKELKFIYPQGEILTINNHSLKQAVLFVLNNPTLKSEPLAVVFPSTGKQLYFNSNLFHAFSVGEISQQELISQTVVIGIYRNKIEVKTTQGQTIESGSLWKLQDKTLVLIDDDQYQETLLDPNVFYKIE